MHWLLKNSGPSPLKELPHALLLGYSVYTSFLGDIQPKWLQCHIHRLTQHANILGLPMPDGGETLSQTIQKCLKPEKAYRLTLAPVVHGFPELLGAPENTLLILSERAFVPASTRPLRLKTVIQSRPLAQIKHGSLLEMITQRKATLNEGFDDLLWVNPNGTISEASTSNIFFVHGETLFTPDPERDACLAGITRKQILSHLAGVGIIYSDNPIRYQELSSMEGAFLSNAIAGIQPVSQIDEWTFSHSPRVQRVIDQLKARLNS